MPSSARWTWIAVVVIAAALALVAFDGVVLARHTGTPWPVAGWCLCAFGVLVLAGRLARRPGVGEDLWATPWKGLDREALVVAALLLILFAAFHLSFLRAASDGRELFVQVRSLVMDWDFDFSNENAAFGTRGTAGIYPPGTAILWAPFHLACHVWLGLLNLAGAEHALLGYTNPYQRAIGLGTFLYGAVALVLIYRLTRRYFEAVPSLLAWSAIVFGSSVAWYLAVESSMAHGASLFAVTLFVVFWHRTRHRWTPRSQFVLGLLGGLAILVRWENGVVLLLPAVEAASDLVATWRGRSTRRLRDLAQPATYLAAGMVVGLLPLVPFWRALPEGGLAGIREHHGVAERGFYVLQVLFSPDHGLLSWTPVIYLAVVGMPLVLRKDRLLGGTLLGVVCAMIVLDASIPGWDGGSGFGARRFTALALPFTLGLAALVDEVRRRPLAIVGAVLGVLVAVNVFVMADMRAGKMNPGLGLPWDRVFDAAYSRIGNPFSFPGSLVFSLRYDAPLRLYDRLGIHRYNDLLIDMGSPGDDEFLLEGWSDRENDGERTFRWAVTTRSRLMVPLRSREKVLHLRLAPFVFPGATAQYVEVWINRQRIGRFEALPGAHDYEVPFYTSTMFQPVEVELRYAWARSPLEVGVSDDTRPLSVQVDYLRFVRTPDRR